MTDVHSKAIRSYNMSRIKSKDTKPEILVRKFLHLNGFRFRIHVKTIPGKPDIVLPKYKAIILIHGCFWHGHPNCKDFKIPKTRTEWWLNKINRNIAKDISLKKSLIDQNWKVIILWACQLEGGQKEHTLTSLLRQLKENLQ